MRVKNAVFVYEMGERKKNLSSAQGKRDDANPAIGRKRSPLAATLQNMWPARGAHSY